MFLQPEDIDGHTRCAITTAPLQDALPLGIVGVPFLAVLASVPLHKMVKHVIRERRRDVVIRAADNVAPVVVLDTVARSRQFEAGCARRIETRQLVWVTAVTIEVLLLCTAPIKR